MKGIEGWARLFSPSSISPAAILALPGDRVSSENALVRAGQVPRMVEIIHVTTPEQIATVRELFLEYQRWLGLDLCFQNFSAELAALPGDYAPPSGRLLLALHEGQAAGCVALRKIETHPKMDRAGLKTGPYIGISEMKRLFVRPEFQSLKIGRALAERIIAEARAAGYTRMRLDTLPVMTRAQALYAALGFREIPPYRHNPVPGAIYMELNLLSGK